MTSTTPPLQDLQLDPQPENPQLPTSRSPSPTAPAPTQTTPGPRATALQKIFSDALTHTLSACSYANFAACFPTPARYAAESLEGLWRDFTERLRGVCEDEFDAILKQRNVVPALNELDRLVGEAKRRKERTGDGEVPVAPHTLPPDTLVQAHLTPFLTSAKEDMEKKLEETQNRNVELMREIEGQRREIEALVKGLENVVGDLDGSIEALSRDDVVMTS
ncbi:MAG: hypothetical protein M1820_004913 [Bogoriella megaspora]|nr:MAG: hypothetical protein M1820_004913 [Bogoriella megaspora]